MRATVIILIVFLMAIAFVVMGKQPVRIVRVWDADTYSLLRDGKITVARITNIDAPELKQNFGGEAKLLTSKLLLGKMVMIDSLGTDKYKRELVSIRIEGKTVDSILLANGWAWLYLKYCNDAILANLQRMAINDRKELWSCGINAVRSPWLYRKYNYQNKMRHCKGCNN